MPTLYLTEDRAIVRRDTEDCLLVQVPEQKSEDGSVAAAYKKRIPLIKIESVVVMGEVTLTASAVHLLMGKKIPIHYLSRSGTLQGTLSPELSKNALLRISQHQAHHSLLQRSTLARQCVVGKLSNQRTMLLRFNRRQTEAVFQQEIEQLTAIIHQLTLLIPQPTEMPVLESGDSGIEGTVLERILGLEGAGSALYFKCFSRMLSDQQQWCFPGRVKRPPTDPVNALLSYAYTILAGRAATAVQIVGFDPYIGYLHSSGYGRPALALDLMEEFRPLIVDSVVLALVNRRMFTKNDFHEELGTYRLKKEPRKLFLTKLEERFNEELQHPIFGYKAKYRHCLELQARLIAKYLTGEIAIYPPFIVR